MFIVFEGEDKAGKSTLVEMFYNHFKDEYNLKLIREPGGDPISEDIRTILKNKDYSHMTKNCEVLLFAASRSQYCNKIHELLDEGYTVISDRYVQSSYVYQGILKGNRPFVYNVNHVATRGFKQDLLILITCDTEEILKRMTGDRNDRIEVDLDEEKIRTIHNGYLELYNDSKAEQEEWIIIDTTNKTPEESFEVLLRKIQPYLINFDRK